MAEIGEQIQIPSHRHKKMFIGVDWNCAGELKLMLSAVLFLCSIITLFQFFPSSVDPDLRHCTAASSSSFVTSPPPVQNKKLEDQVVGDGFVKRSFNGYGTAAYNFILMSAYRGGAGTFAVIGLSSKPLHMFSKPSYICRWIPHPATGNNENITVAGYKILPDWGYGRVYTVVVVNCTFPIPVGHDGAGGRLVLHASTSGGADSNVNLIDTIEALTETPGKLNTSQLKAPPKYEYLYCGSPLYGDLSPQRVREWIAYHARLFGEKSHFVIHDSGGVHPEVMEVLQPWMEKGYVTLQNVEDEERFDGYYHNQFLIVNDCLHRYRFMTKWMFFFDLDEFLSVPKETTIKNVTDSLLGYTQFTIEQRTMSSNLCYLDDDPDRIYRDTKRGIHRDRKYAVQPRNVFATGVHLSQNLKGRTTHKTEGKMVYYHYHGTISERREPCQQMVNDTGVNVAGTPYTVDTTMREAAGAVKRFELRMIGSLLQKTRQ